MDSSFWPGDNADGMLTISLRISACSDAQINFGAGVKSGKS